MTTKYNIQDLSFKNNKFAYFLTYLSFGIVNPTFQQYELLPILFFGLLLFAFFLQKKSFDKLFYVIVFILLALLAIQAFNFGNFTIRSFVGAFMIWLTPYFILRIVQFKFLKIYVNLLYIFSIIGLIFWIIVNLSPDIYRLLLELVQFIGTDPESGQSFIIYNLDYHRPTDLFFMKNPGPFNEGGVFVCYLILALVLNTISVNKLWNTKNVIFIISILSTTSTAGYIALFIFLVGYSVSNRSRFSRLIALPLALLISVLAFQRLPFLSEKIAKQLSEQSEIEMSEDVRVGRFQSSLIGIEIIKQNPLSGKGLYREDRFLSKEEEEIGITGSLNGIVDFGSRYGIIIWLLYFGSMFLSIKYYIKDNSLSGKIAILYYIPVITTGMAQVPYYSPVFIILVYMLYYWKKSNLGTTKDGTTKRKEVQLTPELL